MSGTHDAQTHIFRFQARYPVESAILGELLRPGMRALDVGTAATGRSARLLRELGADVVSIEINEAAMREFAAHPEQPGIDLAVADMTALPFAPGSFGLVLVAFHGFDYLLTPALRRRALRSFERVLAPGGALVFNGFNRLGILFSPSGLRSKMGLKLRARHILSGRFLRQTLIDVNRLEMYQATPRQVIRQVEESSDLRFRYATNMRGSTRDLRRVTLLANAPYYVFQRSLPGAAPPSS